MQNSTVTFTIEYEGEVTQVSLEEQVLASTETKFHALVGESSFLEGKRDEQGNRFCNIRCTPGIAPDIYTQVLQLMRSRDFPGVQLSDIGFLLTVADEFLWVGRDR